MSFCWDWSKLLELDEDWSNFDSSPSSNSVSHEIKLQTWHSFAKFKLIISLLIPNWTRKKSSKSDVQIGCIRWCLWKILSQEMFLLCCSQDATSPSQGKGSTIINSEWVSYFQSPPLTIFCHKNNRSTKIDVKHHWQFFFQNVCREA